MADYVYTCTNRKIGRWIQGCAYRCCQHCQKECDRKCLLDPELCGKSNKTEIHYEEVKP